MLCIALSLDQILSCKANDDLGLGNWAEQYNEKNLVITSKFCNPFAIISFYLLS